MSIFSTVDLNSRHESVDRKSYNKERVIFQKGRRNLAITIDPEVCDKFGLVPGLDAAHFTIEGHNVVLTFSRRRSAVAT
jgi:hypothetical protein